MDTRFRIPLKIQSEWCKDHWWRSYFSIMWYYHVAEAQIWPHLVLWVKFQISDQTVGTPSKFWSGWYIIIPIWAKKKSPAIGLQVLSILPLYGIVRTHGYQIQNHLKIAIRMIYRSSYLGKVYFHPKFWVIMCLPFMDLVMLILVRQPV